MTYGEFERQNPRKHRARRHTTSVLGVVLQAAYLLTAVLCAAGAAVSVAEGQPAYTVAIWIVGALGWGMGFYAERRVAWQRAWREAWHEACLRAVRTADPFRNPREEERED